MNLVLKVLVVEKAAEDLNSVSSLVLNHKNLVLTAGVTRPSSLNKFLTRQKIDVVIIDIEHPLLDELINSDSLLKGTSLILTSVDTNNALLAFDFGATDFLVKPLGKERFNKAIRKVIKLRSRVQNSYSSTVKICVRSEMKDRLIAVDNILWIEALGDYVKIVTTTEKIIVLTTMKSIGLLLPSEQFLRTHRSYIVNLKKVNNIGVSILDIGEKEIPLSRNQKKLQELLAIEI